MKRKTPEDYAAGFRFVSETGVDPQWPNHTGQKLYKSGIWTGVVKNMGGVWARQAIELRLRGKLVSCHHDLAQIRSLKTWLTQEIKSFSESLSV